MKIVQGDELEWVRGLEYRGGTFHYRNLMEGTSGTIDNFELSMGRTTRTSSHRGIGTTSSSSASSSRARSTSTATA